jgi:LCP family protein required for cell wall assembly
VMTNQKKTSKTRPILYLFTAGAILLFIVLGYFLAGYLYDFGYVIGSGGEPPEDDRLNLTASGTAQNTDEQVVDDPFVPESAPALDVPEWDGSSRVNVLVMGIDFRDWSGWENEYFRTDTMLLLTIDPVTKTAGVLSIPRDLWAAIPGFSPQKINTAHYFGDLYKYPGGGPALAVKTVENVIGVPIDYYVRLDFYTFVEFIDLIGGVKVDVQERIELEVIGKAYDTVLEPGRYTLNGELALAYARNRYNEGGDFGRARRQQQIIMGIRDRLLMPAVFTKLIENAPELYTQFTKGILTNIPLSDAVALAALAVQVKTEDITMRVIGEEHIVYGASPDDLSILIPLPDKIRELRDEVFASDGALSPAMQGDPQVLMQLENARITIQNASYDNTLGQRTANYLTSLGANVIGVEETGTVYETTSIIDHTGNPYTLRYLVPMMNIYATRIYHQMAMDSSMDVVLILGTQWQYNNTIP